MKSNNIDNLIIRKRLSAIISNDIDCSNKNIKNTLLDIYDEVGFNLNKIKETDDCEIIVYPEFDTRRLCLLKKLDSYAEKIPYYYTIRPFLKNKFAFLKQARYINVKDILANNLNDEDFIIYLYNIILNREPINSDIFNCKVFLNKKGSKRIDLIIFLLESEEAKRNNVFVKGLLMRKLLRKLVRAVYKIIGITNKL